MAREEGRGGEPSLLRRTARSEGNDHAPELGMGDVVTLAQVSLEEAFDINSPDRPYRIARNTHVRASELVVTIKSEGANVGDNQVEAPVVHMLNIGLSEANGLMRD